MPHRLLTLCSLLAVTLPALAAERITLRTGFTVDCLRHETAGERTRLYLPAAAGSSSDNYTEVATASILSIDPTLTLPAPAAPAQTPSASHTPATLSATELHPLLARAEQAHRVDSDLLASVLRAESHGVVHAVSHAGAQGLMQLMPATAATLGVRDAFSPEQNIDGGSAYLDQLLTRYHDNLTLAVAAYNAGPAAVDRFHGIPPFRETRAYVARVIREFNRRKLAALHPDVATATATLAAGLH